MTPQDHHKWKRRVAAGLPSISTRVYALRGKHYAGCGFHYVMEHTLGSVIRICNDFERPFTITNAFIDHVIVEDFYRSVSAAEASAFTNSGGATKDGK